MRMRAVEELMRFARGVQEQSDGRPAARSFLPRDRAIRDRLRRAAIAGDDYIMVDSARHVWSDLPV